MVIYTLTTDYRLTNIQVIEAIEDRSKLVFFVRGMFLKTNSSNNIIVKI